MRKSDIEKIKHNFPEGSVIKSDILHHYIDTELDFINPKNRNFVIFDLSRKNILYQLDSTHYKFSSRRSFKPELPKQILSLLLDLGLKYPNLELCAWEISSLNPLLEMQILKNVIFVEVEKGFESLVIETLGQNTQSHLIYKPSLTQLENFSSFESLIIIKNLISKAPVNKKRFSKSVGFNQYYLGNKNSISTPKIEKIIVDLLVDPYLKIFDTSQRDLILKNILSDYAVNFKTLFSYARSRNKKEIILDHIEKVLRFSIETGEFYDQ
jgi:hypothetical protein